MALATFLQILRPHSLQQQRSQRIYRVAAEDLVRRLQTTLDEWLSLRQLEGDNTQLANAAAVNRWELMRMAKHAERLEPPRSWAATHRELHNAIVGAARACQLLANGYRFHKSEAVCDGQDLLVETVADASELVAQLQMRD